MLFEILPGSPVSVANTGQDLPDLQHICALQGGQMRLGKRGVLCQKFSSSGGCGFELWSTTLEVLICLLRFLSIMGSLITSSHGKMRMILMKRSERNQAKPLSKVPCFCPSAAAELMADSSGVEAQTVNNWVRDFTGLRVLLCPAGVISAENTRGTPLS